MRLNVEMTHALISRLILDLREGAVRMTPQELQRCAGALQSLARAARDDPPRPRGPLLPTDRLLSSDGVSNFPGCTMGERGADPVQPSR